MKYDTALPDFDTPLASDEYIYEEHEFSYSIPLLFLKSHCWLTNKRIIIKSPNVFLIFPVGSNLETYPLRNIGGVRTKIRFRFIPFILGAWITLQGLSGFLVNAGFYGFVLTLLGLSLLLNAFRTVLQIGTAGVSSMISYVPWETDEAKGMIRMLNQLISAI